MFQYLSKFFYILSGSRKKLALLLIICLLTAVLEALGIGLIGPFLSLVSAPDKIHEIPILDSAYKSLGFDSPNKFLATLGAFIVLIFCVKAVIYFFSKFYIVQFAYAQQRRLSTRLMRAYLSAPYAVHLSRNTSGLINNIAIETNHFTILCMNPLLEVVVNLTIVVVLLILLAVTDIFLLLSVVALMLPLFLIFNSFGKRFAKWGKSVSESQKGMIRSINHGLGGLKETQVIGCEDFFTLELDNHAKKFARASTFFYGFQVLPRVLVETALISFLIAFTSLSLVFFEKSFQDLVPILGVFAVAGMRLIPTASIFMQSLAKMRNGGHTLDVLSLDLKEEEKYSPTFNSSLVKTRNIDKFGRHKSPKIEETAAFATGIYLKDISFRYPGTSELAIRSLSLMIKKGSAIGLVGKSGSGKTTIVDIILGLLQPESGDICVDDTSIYQNLRAWQNLIGYIPQSIFLIDDTIESNIAFGISKHLIDPQKIQQAIHSAQLDEFVGALPSGVKTVVGERGVRLSGGQRQRIGIARALYHEREILILDEATSALDSETERLVSESINNLAGKKTLIIIAHRLSTIEKCDYVYVLDRGELIRQGSPQDVLSTLH